MKAESTIRKQMNQLRVFINENTTNQDPDIKKIVDQAYGMEGALQWVIENVSWNPIGTTNDAKAHYDKTPHIC